MKLLLIILSATISFTATVQDSNDLEKCSQSLAAIERSLTKLDESDVNALVSSVGRVCMSSVEFSEWVNELLYAAVIEKPSYFMKSFSWQPQDVQGNIIKELESPIHDGIDLNKAFHAIQSASGGSEKETILSAIKVAAGKLGISL